MPVVGQPGHLALSAKPAGFGKPAGESAGCHGGNLRRIQKDASLAFSVRIESVAPLRVSIAGRTRCFINAFGEELMVYNAEEAVAAACAATGAEVSDYRWCRQRRKSPPRHCMSPDSASWMRR